MTSRVTLGARTCALLALVLAALVAAGCGSDSKDTSTSSTSGSAGTTSDTAKPLEGKTIAYIQAGDIEYYELSARGAQLAAEQLGGSAKVYDSAFDPQKELANVQDAITQKVDGIVLFPLSDASTKAELRLADRAGIPMTVLYGYTRDVADEGAGFVQIDFFNYSKALGQAFARLVPTGPVAIIAGQLGRSEVTAFHDGFVAGFGDSSRVVAQIAADYDRQKAFNAAQDLIQKYPDLKGLVVGNEDMAIGAASALGPKLSQVAIATQNGSPEGNRYLKDGKFKVTVGGSPSQESALAVRLLADAVDGHPVQEKLCLTPWALNTPDDIQSVDWIPTPEIIAGAVTQPPPCSDK